MIVRALAWRTAARAAALVPMLLAGCALQWQNTQPARQLAAASRPPGSVYAGWRVFEDKCASCHGADATGTAVAPDLRPRVAAMGPARFVAVVQDRYRLVADAAAARGDAAALDALVDRILRREAGEIMMPAWQGEPRVQAHVADLYAYLSARAEGTQGAGRPVR